MMDLVGVFGTHGLVAHENACQHRCERKKKNGRERERERVPKKRGGCQRCGGGHGSEQERLKMTL